MSKIVCGLVVAGVALVQAQTADQAFKEKFGRQLFFDTSLSEPKGQACQSCHQAQAGFNGNGNKNVPVIGGAIPTRFGSRNAPSAAYAFGSPAPGYYNVDGEILFMGGQFWDGRAANLIEQAKAPFLNPVEMNNPDAATVVKKVCAVYLLQMRYLYGPQICAPSQTDAAYNAIADSIAAYESSKMVNPTRNSVVGATGAYRVRRSLSGSAVMAWAGP